MYLISSLSFNLNNNTVYAWSFEPVPPVMIIWPLYSTMQWELIAFGSKGPEKKNTHILRLSGTLLFSGLPMMIWQKKYADTFFPFYIDCFNQKTCEMTKIQTCPLQFDEKCFRRISSVDWDFGANLQINLEVKCMDRSSWKKESIISVFILFVTG